MESNKKSNVIILPKRSIPLTTEQVAQMSPAKKALLTAASADHPLVIRH